MTLLARKLSTHLLVLLAACGFALAAQSDELPRYAPEDVAEHNDADSCWLIVDEKVYDISDYLYEHPGGPGAIIPYCGRDGSEGMNTKGYGNEHSDVAWRQLEQYLIGRLHE